MSATLPLQFTDLFFSDRWLAWGLGPVLAVNLGFWPLALTLEWLARLPSSKDKLIAWRGGNVDRLQEIRKTQEKVPLREQVFGLQGSAMAVVGPGAIFGGILSVYIFDWLLGMNHCSVFDVSCWTAIKSICIMEIVGDFGLYCGHRLLHEVPFLYNNYHCYHHRIGTPTALSTASIDAIDETIQATLPIFFAAVVARPHPLIFCFYVALRVAENVMNHSGMEGTIFDHVFLRYEWLGRARASHRTFSIGKNL